MLYVALVQFKSDFVEVAQDASELHALHGVKDGLISQVGHQKSQSVFDVPVIVEHFPDEYKYALAVNTTQGQFVFYSKRRVERDILLHEVNFICKNSSPHIEQMSVYKDAIDRMDPVNSFNAWNLASCCGPIPGQRALLNAARTVENCYRLALVRDQEQVLKAGQTFIAFVRDGIRCYISNSLRQEKYITDGDLYKESKTKIKAIKGKYRKTFVAIDFRSQLVRFKKNNRKDFEYLIDKDIKFSDIVSVENLILDVYKGEHKENAALKFKNKFTVTTLQKVFFFFAKTETERTLWIEGFNFVLSSQKNITSNDGKAAGEQFKSITQSKPNQMHQKRKSLEGTNFYRTDSLLVTDTHIKGTVMKAIENLTLFNKAEYHKRFLELKFGEQYCYFYEKQGKTQYSKAHLQSAIISAKILTDEQVSQNIEQRASRRNSFLFGKSKVARCSWNFPFSLEFFEKTYELYAPTRNDRDQWVHILNALAQMNEKGIGLETMSPFDFQREQKAEKDKELKQAQMTETARVRDQEQEERQEVDEQADMWLRLNVETMAHNQTQVEPYESEFMHLNSSSIVGICYQMTPIQKPQNEQPKANGEESKDGSNPQQQLKSKHKITPLELHLNLKVCTLEVMKVGATGASKYIFNEISYVDELLNFTIDEDDYQEQMMDIRFRYCFRIQIKTNPLTLVVCQSEEDRDQWVRVLRLIIDMKKLGVDSSKVNPFTFEHYRKLQIQLLTQIQEEENEKFAEPPSDELQIERRRSSSIKATVQIENFETITFKMGQRSIEGYLYKEIDSKSLLQRKKRHLRYLRIVFTTGKLNIKEDKLFSEMRSFPLSDLLSVKTIQMAQNDQESLDQAINGNMLDKDEILKLYKSNETAQKSSWPFSFQIEFLQRSLTFSVRTKRELRDWVRVFTLIINMNKHGFNVSDKNPFVYEKQQMNTSINQSISQLKGSHRNSCQSERRKKPTQNLKSLSLNQDLELQDRNKKNLTSKTLKERSPYNQSKNKYNSDKLVKDLLELKDITTQHQLEEITPPIDLQNLADPIRRETAQQNRSFNNISSLRTSIVGPREPVKALQPASVVNQNITVQHITINYMQQPAQNEHQDGKLSEANNFKQQDTTMEENKREQQAFETEQPRPVSQLNQATQYFTRNDSNYDSGISVARKKKKKKKKRISRTAMNISESYVDSDAPLLQDNNYQLGNVAAAEQKIAGRQENEAAIPNLNLSFLDAPIETEDMAARKDTPVNKSEKPVIEDQVEDFEDFSAKGYEPEVEQHRFASQQQNRLLNQNKASEVEEYSMQQPNSSCMIEEFCEVDIKPLLRKKAHIQQRLQHHNRSSQELKDEDDEIKISKSKIRLIPRGRSSSKNSACLLEQQKRSQPNIEYFSSIYPEERKNYSTAVSKKIDMDAIKKIATSQKSTPSKLNLYSRQRADDDSGKLYRDPDFSTVSQPTNKLPVKKKVILIKKLNRASTQVEKTESEREAEPIFKINLKNFATNARANDSVGLSSKKYKEYLRQDRANTTNLERNSQQENQAEADASSALSDWE